MEEQKTTSAGAEGAHAGCFFCKTAIPLMHGLWSDATRHHFRNSRVEFLKGIRSLIDDRIARLSTEGKTGTRVTVE
jgi:hypothetical protein